MKFEKFNQTLLYRNEHGNCEGNVKPFIGTCHAVERPNENCSTLITNLLQLTDGSYYVLSVFK